jgi:hypothetical protein
MHTKRVVFSAMLAGAFAFATPATFAQYWGGYGGYGWGGWGANIANDPGAGYMRSLGQYNLSTAKAQVPIAQARSINVDTILRWNKAMREAQAKRKVELARQKAKEERKEATEAVQAAIDDGTTLNGLMETITEFPTSQARDMMASTKVSAAAIRQIPFELESEAASFSLSEMTTSDGMPAVLREERFAGEVAALRKAVTAAANEDLAGHVEKKTITSIQDAIKALRANLDKTVGALNPQYPDADSYLRSIAILTQLLSSSDFQHMLRSLEESKDTTLADLVGFMQSYNLRFGAARTEQQKGIFRTLKPLLDKIANDSGTAVGNVAGAPLPEAVRSTFKDLSWKEIEAATLPDPDSIDLKKDQ